MSRFAPLTPNGEQIVYHFIQREVENVAPHLNNGALVYRVVLSRYQSGYRIALRLDWLFIDASDRVLAKATLICRFRISSFEYSNVTVRLKETSCLARSAWKCTQSFLVPLPSYLDPVDLLQPPARPPHLTAVRSSRVAAAAGRGRRRRRRGGGGRDRRGRHEGRCRRGHGRRPRRERRGDGRGGGRRRYRVAAAVRLGLEWRDCEVSSMVGICNTSGPIWSIATFCFSLSLIL